MAKYEEIKRKHFRFPAYSDETGVKLESKRKDSSFSNDENWIITEENVQTPPSQRVVRDEYRTLRRSPRSSQEKAGQSIQQREELKKHRQNLPDYTKRYQPEISSTGKKRLFGETALQSTFKVQEKRSEPLPRKNENISRSYFVPKYIPASMIPEDDSKEVIDKQVLLSSMEKESYLLFDNEPAAFQERKDSDPVVSKFKQPRTALSMTRRQYRETSKKEKKRSVLDQSLEGLIKNETFESDSKGYFKK